MMLELAGISKGYDGPSGRIEAIRDVTMSIGAGEIVVMCGPSGAGKSTLLLLAAGVLKPDRGTVKHQDRDLAGLTDRELARRLREDVGISYQSPRLLAGHTVRANVAIKLLSGPMSVRKAQQAALPWLAKVGLEGRLDYHPGQLSGGERQRVALARALVGDPELLLLDEPTANLDTARANEILDLIARIAQEGTGVLLVTHDPAATRIADRTHELRDGHLTVVRRERAA